MALTINTHPTGYLELLDGTIDWAVTPITAILVTDTHTPLTTEIQFDEITNECTDDDYSRQQVTTVALSLNTGKVRYTHDLIDFTSEAPAGKGDVVGRYVYYIAGTAGALNATDRIIGHVDLTGGGNATAIGAVFSYAANATNGLFEIAQPEAV